MSNFCYKPKPSNTAENTPVPIDATLQSPRIQRNHPCTTIEQYEDYNYASV